MAEKLQEFARRTIMTEMKVTDYHLEMQPLRSLYLYPGLQYDMGPRGSWNRIYIFAAIAALILIIAIINYMNLVIARSNLRLQEVGRKVIGSRQRQIMGLFVSEAMVVTAIASIAAIFLVIMCLPGFNDLTGKQLTIAGFGATWAVPATVYLYKFSHLLQIDKFPKTFDTFLNCPLPGLSTGCQKRYGSTS